MNALNNMNLLKHILIIVFIAALALTAAADTTWVASGNVSGVWTVEGNPYMILEGDVNIPLTQCLVIEPGVEIQLGDSVQILVEGCLQAVGTVTDSIRFINYQGDNHNWNNIRFYYAADSCRMEYCLVEETGFQAFVGIDDGGGIWVDHTDMNFKHCSFRNNFAESTGGGVFIGYSICRFDSCVFFGNWAWDGNGGAVYAYFSDRCEFYDCEFYFNKSATNGGAICFSYSGTVVIDKCLFIRNFNGPGGYGAAITVGCDSAIITNSTFYFNGNYDSGQLAFNGSHSILYNNIFAKTMTDQAIHFSFPASVSIKYCLFDSNNVNMDGYTLPGFERIDFVNTNGDSCDYYQNIFMHHEMIEPWNYNYNLMPTSPCIDAGDPNSAFDPDGTIRDIGKEYYDQTLNPIDDLTITIIDENIHLNWSSRPLAARYYIYKSESPYFELLTAQQFVTTDTFFIDSDAIPEGSGFYKVTIVME